MGRGKRSLTALAEGTGRYRRLPTVLLSPPPLELELLLGWSHQDGSSGKSALPDVGDSGTVALENVAGDEMIHLYIAGARTYMTYPAESLFAIRDLLRTPARCAVISVDQDKSAIVVAVSRPDRR